MKNRFLNFCVLAFLAGAAVRLAVGDTLAQSIGAGFAALAGYSLAYVLLSGSAKWRRRRDERRSGAMDEALADDPASTRPHTDVESTADMLNVVDGDGNVHEMPVVAASPQLQAFRKEMMAHLQVISDAYGSATTTLSFVPEDNGFHFLVLTGPDVSPGMQGMIADAFLELLGSLAESQAQEEIE